MIVQWMGGANDGEYVSVPNGARQIDIPMLPPTTAWNVDEDTEIREVEMLVRTVPINDFWDTRQIRPVLDWYSGRNNEQSKTP